MQSALSTMVLSMCIPRPDALRSTSAASKVKLACIAAIGSQGPRGIRG